MFKISLQAYISLSLIAPYYDYNDDQL